jgi:hypothetical protein
LQANGGWGTYLVEALLQHLTADVLCAMLQRTGHGGGWWGGPAGAQRGAVHVTGQRQAWPAV